MSDLNENEPRRHSWLQEEARMLTPLYKAEESVGNRWRQQALCRDLVDDGAAPVDAWFAPDLTDQAADAADVCFTSCPVRQQCLEWACRAKIRHGVWGGLPASLRLQKPPARAESSPHNIAFLSAEQNPYDTDDIRSPYHRSKLTVWDGVEEDE